MRPFLMILPDLLQNNLKIVFCGTAASAISAREGAYYANPTNYFWGTLHRISLTPHQLNPQNFRQLLAYNIGLTDIAKHATGNDADLTKSDFDADSLRRKIKRYQPENLAFTSKRAASAFFALPTRNFSYGLQSQKIGKTRFWVLPSPSGAARRYWNEAIWQNLADTAGKISG